MLKFMKAYALAMMLTLGLASFFAERAIAYLAHDREFRRRRSGHRREKCRPTG